LKTRVVHIIGNRPHFIKLAPVYRAFKKAGVEQVIIHTGQHYDYTLSEIFIKQLQLPEPNYFLHIQSVHQAQFIGKTIVAIDPILTEENPDLVLVYGDTNSTAAGAIAASKQHILLGHVEAGLREFDLSIPEEINKRITDSVSNLLFAPTRTGYDFLCTSGRVEDSHLVGDVGLDLMIQSRRLIEDAVPTINGLNTNEEYVFLTCHRAANTDSQENLSQIVDALNQIEIKVVFPVHPRTKKYLKQYNLENKVADHVLMLDPLGYFQTQNLIKNATYCITDSGGIIKEAYYHKTPSIIIDKQTEWTEIVADGWTTITGPNTKKITETLQSIACPCRHNMHHGSGDAAEKIVTICMEKISKNEFH